MASKQTHERKRLQKRPRRSFRKSLYSCAEILDVVRAQSCLSVFNEHEDSRTAIHQDGTSTKTKPHVGFLLDNHHSNSSDSSLSMYSTVEVRDEPPATPARRRIRAKTPVTSIGQLERNSLIHRCDRAMDLAEEYQSQLPPRAFTPFCEAEIPKHPPHRLRKIKCQFSLRDVAKEDQKPRPRHSMSYSDADTLVGSESPTSLTSPTEEKEKIRMFPLQKAGATPPHVTKAYEEVVAEIDHNIGLKICADLLTNELASALYCHHPAETVERASGLQIMLMIEVYETVQQQVRQKLYDAHVTGGDEKHMKMVDEILDHWLQVLYSVYDRSQESIDLAKLSLKDESLAPPRLADLTESGDG